MHCQGNSLVCLQHEITVKAFCKALEDGYWDRERIAETFPFINKCRPACCQCAILVSFTWKPITNYKSHASYSHDVPGTVLANSMKQKLVLYFTIPVVSPAKQNKSVYVFNCQLCFWDCPSHPMYLNKPKLVHWWFHISSFTFYKSLLALNNLSQMSKKETGLISMGFQKGRF